jgi:lipopolysaccharide export system protein LptA
MRLWPIPAALLILALAVSPAGAFSKPEASDEPVHVVADQLEVDDTARIATFTGTVKATQGDVNIDSDVLEVYYEKDEEEGAKAKTEEPATGGMAEDASKVRKVVAIGHVKIKQGDRLAVGRKATYWAGGRKMLLEGQATVWKGKNQVSGEKITVFMDQDRAIVHGKPGKRVSVTITPGAKKKKK